MGQPAARMNDQVTGTDIHIVLVPSPTGAVPTPTPHPFSGTLVSQVSTDVYVNGRPAATQGSVAVNNPPHLPIGGPSFAKPPTNQGRVLMGSATVFVNGRPMARQGDQVLTCNDPVDAPTCVIAQGSTDVMIG